MSPGTELSHYKVQSRLGAGGMGEVYRAHDTQLDRIVALKVLRPEVASDPERMRRFQQEARAAAALNHPNVAQVYEIGETAGIPFIAMEFVEGETLASVINGRPLSFGRILEIALPLCDVLAEAHAKGITHRDIKPGNIILTSKGQPKILDFGVVKFDRPGDPGGRTLTDPGTVVGTVEYMSPEQALGRDVDSRSDLFSLGAVLYEMATGRRAYTGGSVAEVYDAILNRNPAPPAQFNPELPSDFECIIAKALEKNRDVRYQTASDMGADLRRLEDRGSWTVDRATQTAELTGTFKTVPQRRPTRHMLVAAAALLVLAAGAAGWFRFRGAGKSPSADWQVLPLTSYPGSESQVTFSPDGNQVAFMWNGSSEDNWDIYVKVVDAGTPLRLTSDPGADSSPAWSPDGRHIAFLRQGDDTGAIFLIPALGGLERKIADVNPYRIGVESPYLAWSPDGKTLAVVDKETPEEGLGLFLLDVASGKRTRFTRAPPKWLGDSSPAYSADGKRLAFVRTISASVQDLYVVPIVGGEPRRLTQDNRRIFGMAWNRPQDRLLFSSNRAGNSRLWQISPSGGAPERLAGFGENASFLAITRQGHRIAYSQSLIDTNIWRYPLGGSGEPARLISSTRHDQAPQCSPDGQRIVFTSNRSGSMELWVCDREGRDANRLTSFNGPATGSPRWSPDGRRIAFDSRPEANPDVYVIPAEGGTPRRLTTDPSEDIVPNWSRNGQWIYFASNRTGTYQVWKMPAEGGDAIQVTRNGGFHAIESVDGRYLYYAKALNAPGLWRAPVGGGEEAPVLESFRAGYWAYWAVVKDGIYFLERQDAPNGARRFVVKFFDFDTRKDRELMQVRRRPFNSGLALSPDGKSFLYTQVDASDTDIMLVEKLR